MSRKLNRSKSNGHNHRSPAAKPALPLVSPQVKQEILVLFCVATAIVSGLGIFGLAGQVGRVIDAALGSIFGVSKFLFPVVLLAIAGRIAWPAKFTFGLAAKSGLVLFLAAWGGLVNCLMLREPTAMFDLEKLSGAGGYVGLLLGYPLLAYAGFAASVVILVALTLISLILIFNVSMHELSAKIIGSAHFRLPWPFGHRLPSIADHVNGDQDAAEPPTPEFRQREIRAEGEAGAPTEARIAPPSPDAAPVKKRKTKLAAIPLELLENRNAKPTAGDINGRMQTIKKCLENFGIPVEMGEVSVGPTVTQFTLKPAEGIKLSRITSLSNDLAMALAAHPIRIEAPIPGKPLVGIEVPNQQIAIVGLREVLESKPFAARKSSLTIGLGKDVSGRPWVADLGKMPHLLVAGATGSGKTVCLNAIVTSLLYQNGPDTLKLMLIDPKRVELPVYNGIPHLICPAITEVPKIINALKWSLGEMDRRFELLSETGCRDLNAYNEMAEEKLPYIVIAIDELADLMVASASEVEASIIRLAQMARAVGIHLIVATQRPSVDVITGLIKANITTRIAFSVASATDSRTILDTAGAEKLVGRGDMLFMTPEVSKPKRIQCCYVSDDDTRKVVDFIVSQLDEPADYLDEVTEKRQGGLNGSHQSDFGYDENGEDELLDEAKQTVVRAGKASASYLQRRLKIGYARAARLLDLLEERGIIGPGDGAKPRPVLVSPVQDADGAHVTDADEPNEDEENWQN